MSFGFGIGDFLAVLQLAETIRGRFEDSPEQFRGISDELQSLSTVLQNFELRDLTDEEKTSLHSILTGCRNTLSGLQSEIERYEGLDAKSKSFGDGFRKIKNRLQWDEEKIEYFRSRITANISLLNAFSINSISKITSAINTGVLQLNQRQEDQEREQEQQKIIEWITPIDYSKQQNDFISRRLEGTGKEMLNSKEFQAWLKTSKQTLFCPGIPGAGKTMISCIVVDDLSTQFRNDANIGIAFVYCNYRQHQEQKPEDLLLSLLKQLTQQRPSTPTNVKQLYEDHSPNRSRIPLDDIKKALHTTIQLYSRVFIVIDALDECHGTNEGRFKLLSEIRSLRDQTQVNIFATSRFIPEIMSLFEDCEMKEIRAAKEDVQSYVNGRIPQLLRYRISKYPDLQEAIKTTVVAAVDGMFLLAKLHMDSLSSKSTPGDIKQALKSLKSLPNGVEGLGILYDQAMKRITGQNEGSRELAKGVLSWVTHARRPLITAELQHALAVRYGTVELDEDFIPEVEDLVSICAGLITTDEQSGIVRWIHYTTQEYFERTWTSWFPQAQLEIARTCITYISFDTFRGDLLVSKEDIDARLQLYSLYGYAAQNWGHHAREAESSKDLEDSILGFFASEDKVSSSTQAVDWGDNYSRMLPRKLTGLHLAAYFGLAEIMSVLLRDTIDPNIKSYFGETPLAWAADRGQESAVKLLLKTENVDYDSKDHLELTPLSSAALRGHVTIAKLLIETGKVNIDWRDQRRSTPLSYAAAGGHVAVVELLLGTGKVDINSKDSLKRTPLSFAVSYGRKDVVKLLLDTGNIDINSRNSNGNSALSFAVSAGNEDIAKLLLRMDNIDVDARNHIGQTPLSFAAYGGYVGLVKMLLDTGKANTDSADLRNQTPLSLAASKGNESVVKLLLESGKVDVNSKDTRFGRTPLSWAAESGDEAVVKLLIEDDKVDIDSRDGRGQTPLSWAAKAGHVAVVKMLLETGKVDINAKHKFGISPLGFAARAGREAVVKLLLGMDEIDVDSEDNYGNTALALAERDGQDAVVELLSSRMASAGAEQ